MCRDVSVQARLNESRLEYGVRGLTVHRHECRSCVSMEITVVLMRRIGNARRCQFTSASIDLLPSAFTGTLAAHLATLYDGFTVEQIGHRFLVLVDISDVVRLSNSLMRPPVLTPNMNKPRLRTSNVPVKQAETSRISLLSRGRVPFIYQPILSLRGGLNFAISRFGMG